MPFRKVGKDHYVSPSGRSYNSAQVKLYYAGGGKFPGQRSSSGEPSKAKQLPPINYAAGLRR